MENKYSEVTMNEFVESTKAKQLYEKEKEETFYLISIPGFILLFSIVLTIVGFLFDQSVLFLISIIFVFVSFISLFVCRKIRETKISKYREIYKLAKRNDDIRYDEKIRFMERKRLEKEFENLNSTTTTNIQKPQKTSKPIDLNQIEIKKIKD